MRKYKLTDLTGDIVDLDDDTIYKHLPKSTRKLEDLMFKEIGYAFCYMNYFHPDIFPENNPQRLRVYELVRNFTNNRKDNYNNVNWYREQVFIFQDEIENMC